MKRFNKYFRLRSQKISRKAKLITLLMFMILLAASILIVNKEVIHYKIYHSLGNTIKEWVAKETNGMYVLQYDSMQINTLKKHVSLRNVSFLIDSTTIKSRKPLPKNLYGLTAPELFLDIKSIWNILFKDKLEFNGINIKNPSLTIFNLSRPDSASNLSLQSGKLYLKINEYLDEFNINKFKLSNGSIHYKRLIDDDQQEIKIDKIDVIVRNLVVNAANQTAGTDHVRVILKNPSFILSDGLHKLEMENILLDSKSERVELNEVHLYPLYEKLQETDIGDVNLYNLNIPKINLDGIDFNAAYLENKLLINSIHIPYPEIIIDTHNKVNGKSHESYFSKQLSVLFKKIQAKELLLEDGKVDFMLEGDNKMRNIRIANTTINITNLDLDTLKYSKENSHINFDALNLELKDYHLILPDSIHELTAEKILYSSDSTRLSIFDLAIEPSKNSPESNRIKTQIPLIILKGLDAKKYMQTHQLLMDEIFISGPDITYYKLNENDSSSHDQFNFSLKNKKIADLIAAGFISVSDVNFKQIEKGVVRTHLKDGEINLYDFSLKDNLPTDSLTFFNSKEVTYNFPVLDIITESADKISATGASGRLSSSSYNINHLVFTPANQSYGFDGSDISLKGLHLKKVLQDQLVELDSVQIGEAIYRKIGSEQKPSNEKHKQVSLKVSYVSLDNGKVIINNKKEILTNITGIKGHINDLEIVESAINLSGGKLFTEKFLIQSKKNNMYIGASKAEIGKNSIILYMPYIEPIEKGEVNFTSLTASQAAVIDLDLDKLLNEQKFFARQLKLLTMNFELHKSQQQQNKKRSLHINWNNILKDNLKEIAIDRVIASGPELSFEATAGKIQTGNFEVELKNFNTNLDGTKYLLNSENIRLKIKNILYEKDGKLISAGLIALDENRKLISLNTVKLTDDNIEISMPLIFAKRMDLKKLAEEDKLIGEELEIAGFNIIYKSKGKKKAAQNAKKLPLIHFDRFNAHQGVFTYIDKDGQEFKMNNISGQLINFDTEKNTGQPFYAENFKAEAGTFTGLVKDQMDRLLITGITVTESGRKLHFDHLYIKPEYEKIKYAYLIGHEANWMNINLQDLTVHGFNIAEALKDQPSLTINKIDVKALKARIYRDKKLPYPENKYVPLPQQKLREIELPVFIESVRIRSADINYEELGELAFEPGKMKFQQLDVILSNITNIPHKQQVNNQMVVKISGSIEGTSLFTTASFDLLSKDNDFTFSGKMGAGGLLKFNKILESNAFLRIEKGQSRGITFNMKANDNYAYGKMVFYYKNLKISVIDKKTNKTSGIDESIASFFANTFVINSNNPSLLDLKEGNIYFKRDKSKSVFNYWAKSFLSGIVSSLGVKNHKKELKEALLENKEAD